MSRGGERCLTLSKFLSMHLMILTDCLCAFSFGFTFWSLLTAALINSYNNLFNECARWRFVMSNVNSEKMIPSSSAVPLNSTERLALSAHCFGLMSLNFSVFFSVSFLWSTSFPAEKTYKSCIYPSVLHYLLSRLTFVPGASSVNPRSAGRRSSSVSTFNLKSAVIQDHNNTVN